MSDERVRIIRQDGHLTAGCPHCGAEITVAWTADALNALRPFLTLHEHRLAAPRVA